MASSSNHFGGYEDRDAKYQALVGSSSSSRKKKASKHKVHPKAQRQARTGKAQNRDLTKLKGKDLAKAVAEKYGIVTRETVRDRSSDDEDIGELQALASDLKVGSARASRPGDRRRKEEQDVEKAVEDEEEAEMRRGFKYFLYHHHSFLGVFCVRHANDLPRCARFFLFLFNLEINLMCALTLPNTGMDVETRVGVTVLISMVVGMAMSMIVKDCVFDPMMAGRGCMNRCFAVSLVMLLPFFICAGVIALFLLKLPDDGIEEGIVFGVTTVLSLLLEILAWYWMYDCCKSYCGCFLCCCPHCLDDAEVARADARRAERIARQAGR